MKPTQDLYLTHKPAKDNNPRAARETIKLLQEYGLDVPREKWETALRGVSMAEEKAFVAEDTTRKVAEPELEPITFVRSSAVDPVFALTHEELLKKPAYFFAPLQAKTRAIHIKLKACRTYAKAQTALRNHFYNITNVDLPENFSFYANNHLGCGVLCYTQEGALCCHWFLGI
jgi:hypothetical protein